MDLIFQPSAAPSSNPIFSGDVTFTSTLTQIGTGTTDGSDNKAITFFGGGAYGTTRGSGIAVIGNEYPSIGGDLELIAGDSATSGMIKFYVGNGSGTPVLAGSFARATQQFNCYGNMVTTGSVISVYNMVNTSASTTLTDITRAVTIPGNLVTSAYVNNGYTAGLTWSSTDENAAVPKAGIFAKTTGAGTYVYIGTSNAYATGVTSSVSVGPNGEFACGVFSATAGSFSSDLTINGNLLLTPVAGNSILEIGNSALTGTVAAIDFHFGVTSTQDFNVRINNFADQQMSFAASSGTIQITVVGVTALGATVSTSTYCIFGASTTAISSLRIPHGAAPTSPVNGDMWTTTAGAFIRINGVTKTFTLI